MRKLLLNPTPLFRKLRQLSLLLTLLLALPQTAWGQDTNYGITIGTTPVTSANKDDVLNDGKISFTPATDTNPTNTLTLRGAEIGSTTTSFEHGITVTNLANLTIICAGNSYSDVYSTTGTPIYCTDASCDLTFTSEENSNNYIQFDTNATSLVEGFKTVTYVENKAEQFLPQKQIGFITYNVVISSNALQSVSRFTTNYKTFRTSQSNQFTISGNGGITFDPSSCTLTFDDDVHLGVRPNNDERKACIEWGIDKDLTVVIAGECEIRGGSEVVNSSTHFYYPFENTSGNANRTISFKKKAGVTNANLALTSIDYTDANLIHGFASISISSDLKRVNGLPNNNSASISAIYDISVAGAAVSVAEGQSGITAGSGKVYFDGTNNILTLDGANVTGMIKTGLENLTIKLKGTNTIVTSSNNNGIYSDKNTGTLTFTKEETGASLNITSGVSVIRGFASLNLENSGLYTATVVPHKIIDNASYKRLVKATNSDADTTAITNFYISESVTYQLWLGGVQVTAANYSGTRWSYNNNTTTLTLDNYTAGSNDYAFISNMPNLNVYLKGTNTVTFNGTAGSRAFFSTYNNNGEKATLTFSTDENNKGKLDASSYFSFCEGFRDINGIYCLNGLGYYPSTCKIEAKYTPTMHFAKWDETAQDYTGGNVVASETLETTWGVAFKAPRPEFSNGYALGGDSTRYTYSYAPEGIVEIPLTATDPSTGNNTFGEMNILKAGTVIITCTYPGNLQNEACSASYTLKITRGFNNPFATAEQIYATYYNENEDLALPDGIVAYVVTGVSGNSVTTTATGYLPQNTAVLLEKTGNVGTTITGYTGSAGNFNGNLLKYTSANAVVNTTGKEYILYKNEFVKATGTISGACYLDLNGVAPTRGMYGIGNDGSTAIEGIDVEATEDETWYDLQGRRIQKPTKAGIYIVNGKKMIINNK